VEHQLLLFPLFPKYYYSKCTFVLFCLIKLLFFFFFCTLPLSAAFPASAPEPTVAREAIDADHIPIPIQPGWHVSILSTGVCFETGIETELLIYCMSLCKGVKCTCKPL